MKYPIIIVSFLPVSGMALFPFILLNKKGYKQNADLINHELIHIRQQLELLIIPFYFLYLLNYLANLGVYRNHQKAYLNICFEREAYRMEKNPEYLKSRSFWGWLVFLKK